MGLNQAVQERVVQMDITDQLTRRIHVKISGCPKGCGQHTSPTSASTERRSRSAITPFRRTFRTYEGGDVRYGQRLKARLPAKRVPEAVETPGTLLI